MRAVLLHGFGADRMTWAGTVVPGAELVTPDLPGHGDRVEDLGDGSLGDITGRVLAGLDGGGWLVGHSLGGGVALEMAAREPGRWDGLVLLAPLGLGREVNFDAVMGYPNIADAGEMLGVLKRLVANEALMLPAFADYGMAQLGKLGAREALRKVASGLEAGAVAARLAAERVSLDVTVVWGDADPVASPDEALVKDLVLLPGVGHIPHVEAMARVNALLAEKILGV